MNTATPTPVPPTATHTRPAAATSLIIVHRLGRLHVSNGRKRGYLPCVGLYSADPHARTTDGNAHSCPTNGNAHSCPTNGDSHRRADCDAHPPPDCDADACSVYRGTHTLRQLGRLHSGR